MSCWWDISSHTSIEYMWRKYEIWPLAAVLTSGENRLATFVHKHTRPMYFINRQGLFRPTGLLSNEISFKLHLNKSLLLFNLRFDSNSSYTWNLREQQQQRRLLWYASISCTDDRIWLTDSLKLEIGNFACLTPPLSYCILWEYLSGQSDGQYGHPGLSGHPGHPGRWPAVGLVSLGRSGHPSQSYLHNFQFYLAHLWTDFQSC